MERIKGNLPKPLLQVPRLLITLAVPWEDPGVGDTKGWSLWQSALSISHTERALLPPWVSHDTPTTGTQKE